ncbi:MAG: ribosomal protein S18-alanine N-acetyltransferase [Moritella sp.]|uniref:ribosomal protein S18-alanine N-acetyltransferase n=1 Tax=Moritella sp. TaxID=78556 RepID=UPI0025CF8F54|nr:ribosomal protein S18-alanine N-acetyltransferase [Moritella sp.]NQZ94196.1 ribosomal protein S18-alanine N-acetyltransferase [Moritella sp.]
MPKIIPLTLEHLPLVQKVETASHAFPWSAQILASNFGARYFNFVLIKDEQILGYYFANQVAGEASLLNIAVAPEHQGKGYGKLLINHLIKECQQQELFQLWLEVRESNHGAYQLYLNTGFNEVDRRINYYPAAKGREDAIMMCYIV